MPGIGGGGLTAETMQLGRAKLNPVGNRNLPERKVEKNPVTNQDCVVNEMKRKLANRKGSSSPVVDKFDKDKDTSKEEEEEEAPTNFKDILNKFKKTDKTPAPGTKIATDNQRAELLSNLKSAVNKIDLGEKDGTESDDDDEDESEWED
ncbi:hypothetical protein BOX15_Mlig001155g2 [Macrostomum lignano]|uniref:Uncharacterized protein n=1 Tax=Macrostomum lignano TaxID=282301 RepID=A0A267G7R8_9PLAT|nr:hypothetical protein BOX15_Mlig001155g2 [Macrostomum lignano]